jgi:protein-S-isoprenylcysteine O-methyltransferase Ste14
MKGKKDNPGVYIPPPLFYVFTFLTALFLQKRISIDDAVFQLPITRIAGIILLTTSLCFLATSLKKFLQTKNSLMTIRPAASLQTNGIYNISRNPMYVGLAFLYLALSCFIGNWWNIILFPILFLVVQSYIIKKEEQYLIRRFGHEYLVYKAKVRRWL